MSCKCIDCTNYYPLEMKCRPNSRDCESEYNLDEEDLHTPRRCDFYEKKKVREW